MANTNLEDHTVEELKDIAAKENVDLAGATHKADIIKAIEKHRGTKGEGKKKEPAKPQAQIDAERAEKGGTVPEEEQGKPTDAREWTALNNERELKAARTKFEAEWAAKSAAK